MNVVERLREEVKELQGMEIIYHFDLIENGCEGECAAFIAASDIDVGITIHGFLSEEQKKNFHIPEDADDWPIACIGRSKTDIHDGTYSDQYILFIKQYITAIKSGHVFGNICSEGAGSRIAGQEMPNHCPFT